MTFSVDSLIANLSKKGLFSPDRYKVQIWSPVGNLTEDDLLYCSSPSLPGRGFSTQERFDHGPIRKIPYTELYNDASFAFYNSKDLHEWSFFNDWQEFIGGGKDYYLPWYDDILGKVVIQPMDRTEQVQKTITLFEAYPVTLSDIQMGYEMQNDTSTFTVEFAFHHFEIEDGAGAAGSHTPRGTPAFEVGGIDMNVSGGIGGMA